MSETARILASTPWLTLATVDDDESPVASYVPFALLPDGLGILVSGLAAHTAPLLKRRRACVLIVSEEAGPKSVYARPRLAIDVLVHPADANSETASAVWSALEARHGAIIKTLRSLPDFQAIHLEPVRARLVLGFGSADVLDALHVTKEIKAAQTLDAP